MNPEETYSRQWQALISDPRGFEIFKEPVAETTVHPENFIDYQCAFAARHIENSKPRTILDVGSYRHFILGLAAYYPITSLDIRPRRPLCKNEVSLTGDAKRINLPDASFDLVLSLCALEHFGLGRYGDEFDPQGDQKAMGEMIRILKPGGILILTTTITRSRPCIAFNAHRIYNLPIIHSFCRGLSRIEENFYSHEKNDFCRLEEVTDKPRWWDVYCGCWRKI